MELTRLLFSFRGRINRAKYWLATLILIAIVVAVIVIAAVAHFWILIGPLSMVFLIIFFVISSAAIAVKRLHDREKSAWWLVPFYLVPFLLQTIADFLENAMGDDVSMIFAFVIYIVLFALSVWAFVEIGCLRGTVGENRYGPDPLAGLP